jgi:hypothetical protein
VLETPSNSWRNIILCTIRGGSRRRLLGSEPHVSGRGHGAFGAAPATPSPCSRGAQVAPVDPSDPKSATETIDAGDGRYKAVAYKEATAQYRQAKEAAEKAIAHAEDARQVADVAT